MQDFQEECPNVLFFKDTTVANNAPFNAPYNESFSPKDIYFFASNYKLKANGIQLHSTKNIIPDNMPFNLSPDKRFLHFGPLDQSEAFKSADFKKHVSNGYNAYKKLDIPKLEKPLLVRPLNMDKVGHLVPLDSEETKEKRPLNMDKVGHLEPVDPGETNENDLSQFSKSQITRTQTPEPSKFIIPINEKVKPTISDLPKRLKPYKGGG